MTLTLKRSNSGIVRHFKNFLSYFLKNDTKTKSQIQIQIFVYLTRNRNQETIEQINPGSRMQKGSRKAATLVQFLNVW